ncbi:MAG: ParB/RepB/Spo0J family partition protein [Polyangiaceae bacterium]|jgi:ParB family transcriptional regulator, chromosome partitioning protein
MTTVTMIPVSQVRVLNPRARSKAKFTEIVNNIAALGLKKPITVTPRAEEPGTYDLVCGQGRLEAFQALEQSEIPALIRDVAKHDCYIMSLAENLAKRHSTSMDLVREIQAMRQQGLTHAQIAQKIDFSTTYVGMLFRLIDKGEECLIRAVERRQIPIAVATEIATSDDASIQQSLADAYTSRKLRGKALLIARRLVEDRRGKKAGTEAPRPKTKVTAEKLVRTYQKECRRQKRLAKAARVTETRLIFVANALKSLLGDENFVNLLRAEKLDKMPEYLADAVRSAS